MSMPLTTMAADPLTPALEQRVRDYVLRSMDELGVPGAAVAVVTADGVAYIEGFGQAGGVDVTADTPFDLASVSKSFTAIAVFQLAQSGAIELDDRLKDYMPWIDDTHAALGDVTIRDLLGHASGWTIGDGQANLVDTSGGPDAIQRNARRLASVEPTNGRGTFEYSNANYDVLAALIEIVSESSYADYMASSVFEPLDMAAASAARADAEANGLAQGYIPFLGLAVPYEVPYIPGGAGSGYLHASAEDLAHALVFHLDGGRWNDRQVLGADWVAELHRPQVYADTVSGYAGGLWTFPFWPGETVDTSATLPEYHVPMSLQHEGDHASTATSILVLPEEGWGVAVLLPMNDQAAPSRFHQIDDGIASILLGLDPRPMVAYEDVLLQHLRLILAAVVLLQLAGVVVATRRLRRWRAAPESAPSRLGGAVQDLLLPGVVDIGVSVAAWWLYLDRADAPLAVGFVYAPDVVGLIGVVSILGMGWGAVRTIATLRVMRRGSPAAPQPEPTPAA
jgi:CubicO group peptidase (beta-lactamase class C family)